MSKTKSVRGFTLLEILLVVGIIAILAGIVILAINPSKQLGDSRNAQRRSDVLTILNAIYQYTIDTNGDIPAVITATGDCGYSNGVINATTTGTGINLYTTLVGASSTYLSAIPVDPSATGTRSGYSVVIDGTRLTVCAPQAENVSISVTR